VENKWTTASMGGEVRPEIQSTAFANWPDGSGSVDGIKACIEMEHTTWKIDEGSSGYSSSDSGVAAAVRLMGYDLTVDHAYYHDTAQGTTTVGVRVTNDGVAPFYYPWKVSLGLRDSDGNVVKTWDTDWDLTKVMPTKIRAYPDWNVGSDPTYLDYGYPEYYDSDIDLSGVAQGGYQLVMKVNNPLSSVSSNAKQLRFANAAQGEDGWLDLGDMSVGQGSGSGSGGAKTYEAEASANTLAGGAVVASCANCSGGSKVGYVGNGGTLTFNGVDGGSGGSRQVTLAYASAVARSATVQVNGGAAQHLDFRATSDWTTPAAKTLTLDLAAGTSNTVTLSGSTDWAPDIDSLTVP
jgi:hypothetical protein